jgi:polyvinyl alcohol dehydrogenase (cytochrome)
MQKALAAITGIVFAATVSLPLAASADDSGRGDGWPMFGRTLQNTAAAGSGQQISQDKVGELKPAWVVTTGGDVSARASVADHVAYFPDWGGNLWAVDTNKGKVLWQHQFSDYGLTAGTVARATPAIADDTLYIGTQLDAFMLAIDARTGALKWKTQLDPHPEAIITSSAAVLDGVIFVGVASNEESAAANPAYPCCTFRGSALAIDAKSGKILWKTFMAPQGYSGTAVWGSNPVIDEARRTVFYGTGNNYAKPTDKTYLACIAAGGTEATCHSPDDHFDSIVALDMTTGQFRWTRRLSNGDDWNVACLDSGADMANCPANSGADADFGSAPNELTVRMPNGHMQTILGAGQKNGLYSAFDPDTGRMLWAQQVGPGATLGGIEWGSATDGKRIYVAISNANHLPYAAGTAGSWNALDPATGKILWQTPDPNGAIDLGPVAVANDVVYAPSMASDPQQSTMFALSAETGRVLWQFASGASVVAGASISDGMVLWGSGYAHIGNGSANNKFYGFSVNGR